MLKRYFVLIFTAIALIFALVKPSFAADENRATGLTRPTVEESAKVLTQWKRINTVHLNALGQQRIKEELKKNAAALKATSKISTTAPATLTTIDTTPIVPDNKDFDAAIDPTPLSSTKETTHAVLNANTQIASGITTSVLPSSVDNSATIWFPPIGNQGSLGSCAPFSIAYYQLSYSEARDKNIAINSGDRNFIYSPKFVYNLINGGNNLGSFFFYNYSILLNNGVPSWNDFPYDGNFRAWPLTVNIWRNAINSRINDMNYATGIGTSTGLEQLKQLINNGHIMTFGTDIYDWQYLTVKNNPFSTEDDPYVGQKISHYSTNKQDSGHAMTIVGYNDNIWTDINGNNVVDPQELGALKIANQWGTSWGNSGFMWLSYDALKSVSAVTGGPKTNRIESIWDGTVFVITVRPNYSPRIVGQFTINQLERNQNNVFLGSSSPIFTLPTQYDALTPLYSQGGAYAYDGSTTAVDATFVIDLSDVIKENSPMTRYYLEAFDNVRGNPTTVKNFKLIDILSNTEVNAAGLPRQFDRTSLTTPAIIDPYVDYAYNPITYALSTTAANGSISRSPDQTKYAAGSVVRLTATPNNGYEFASWSGDISGNTNPINVTISSNKNITANFVSGNAAPVVNAGDDQTIVFNTTASLQGSATDDGTPNSTLSITWSVVSAAGTVTFANKNAAVTTATFSKVGSYVLRLTANDGAKTTSDDMIITVNDVSNSFTLNVSGENGSVAKDPNFQNYTNGTRVTLTATPDPDYVFYSWSGDIASKSNPYTVTVRKNMNIVANFIHKNLPPVANAGEDQTIQLPSMIALSGSATDDGWPKNTLTVTWKKVSGPGSVIFKDLHSLTTQASFSVEGSYVIRLSAYDGSLTTNDDLTVTVIAAPTHTLTINAQNGTVRKTPSRDAYSAGTRIVLVAVPNQGYKFSSWSGDVTGKSAAITITMGDNNMNITANFMRINTAPVVHAGTSLTITLKTTLNLIGTATDDGLPNNTLTAAWTKVSGKGTVTFSAPSNLDTKINFSAEGIYVLRLTVSDGELKTSANITVTVKK